MNVARHPIKISYDPEVDAAYLYLSEDAHHGFTYPFVIPDIAGDIILDFDLDNRLMGIEVLSASNVLPPALLVAEKKVL